MQSYLTRLGATTPKFASGEPEAGSDALLSALLEMRRTYSSFEYLPILLADSGHAWTIAAIRDFNQHWSVALEGIQAVSSAPLRPLLGEPAYAREQMLQLAVRCDSSFP